MKTIVKAGFGFALFLFALGQQAQAQEAGKTQVYEVATIKPSAASEIPSTFLWSPVRFSARGQTLRQLIKTAYEIRMDAQLVGAPAWAETERFDVEAKLTPAQAEIFSKVPLGERLHEYKLMLRGLLEERFALKTSQQSRELPVYALVVAKGGPKIKEVAGLKPEGGRLPPPPPPGAMMPSGIKMPRVSVTPGRYRSSAIPIDSFTNWLAGRPETGNRIVVDRTGLAGTYDFDLHWNPEALSSAKAEGGGEAPDLFSALREQLGLQLVNAKEAVPVVVVEHVERPSDN
ncbi:TIGR03435 family protein [Terriglobus roseus]|uniref:Soil-associated protein, TIGR03435 family n=1 Tax=Terriglobus roseus TaxID=392734 RepID=A0A1G7MMQ2_9BACT|nr:TIGR03435 family protein [Terriglobus roseus]SDF63052.1 soil-associated protein, TIGR03435 family [Terriglobus roseus]